MNEKPAETPTGGPVLLYDGECGLCQRVVGALLRLDRRGVLRFAALQGPFGRARLVENALPTEDFDSLVFIPAWPAAGGAQPLLRTDGALAALEACGPSAAIAARVLRWIPRRLRNAAYRGVARVRYRIFGNAKPRPPRPEWVGRFL